MLMAQRRQRPVSRPEGTATEMMNFVCATFLAGLVAGCAAPDPPPFPPNSSADPQVHGSSNLPRLALRDQTTEEIKHALNATKENVKSTETIQHDMHNMPGVKHGEVQHSDEMKMKGQGNMEPEKKAIAEETKKTPDEMKAPSDAMKKKSDEMKTGATIYTCPMHPQIQPDKPDKCPICGMTLVKRKKAK